MTEPEDGRKPILKPGFSYLPHFISKEESEALITYFGDLSPLWEQRHRNQKHERNGDHSRRLTRPVYWLGAWQFACLGYYAEALAPVMQSILRRVRPILAEQHHDESTGKTVSLPNTCLINYYGREKREDAPPRDYARLRMHRDAEPGPVIMFCIGQPGLLEFLDPNRSQEPELSIWTRHRAITILSGSEFKDRLYHRIRQVRTGSIPLLHTRLENFELRRISVSFRHVPEELIEDFAELPESARRQVQDYVHELAQSSAHYRHQLAGSNHEPDLSDGLLGLQE